MAGGRNSVMVVHDIYAALVESADDAIVAKDTDGAVIAWNRSAERLFGYTAEEMIGHSTRRLLPADRAHEEDLILKRIRAGERIGQFFTKRLHKSGRLVDVSLIISPVRNGSDEIVGISKIARDAGPLLSSQRRLRESERRFRTLADNISQLVWISGADGDIHWFNKRWYDYTGAAVDKVEGWGWMEFVHPDHSKRVEESFRKSVENGEDWEDVFPVRGITGEYRWFLSRAKPIREVLGQQKISMEGLGFTKSEPATLPEDKAALDMQRVHDGTSVAGGGAIDGSVGAIISESAAEAEDGEIVYWFGTKTDITEQREQEEQIRLLLMEVNHRSKNLLSTVQALARRTAPDDSNFIARFEDRIRSLAVNQDILVRRAWREVPVSELVHAQLSFLKGAPGEVNIEGPDCSLTPRAAEVVGMALHELATNALKYGALSVESGHVDVGWSGPPEREGFSIWWRERDGPPVAEPAHQGFGTTLIRDVPRHNLSAKVELNYPVTGVCWSLECDGKALVDRKASPAKSPKER